LFRFFPEAQLSGFYADNFPLQTTNKMGDFAGTLAAGFYLDYISAARYASLRYDTFAELFTHQTEYDRAGEAQFAEVMDDENLSPTTKLRLIDLYYRNGPTMANMITSEQAPQFNTVAALLLLANVQASVSQTGAELSHYWGRNWSSDLGVHQETFWGNGVSSATDSTSYSQSVVTSTQYHFTSQFSLGAGYRFSDFRFTAPGRPDEQAHWPFVGVTWNPTERLYLHANAGVVISETQGTSGAQTNFGGEGQLEYNLERAHLKIDGGQRPELAAGLAGVGVSEFRWVAGSIRYDFTPRMTGTVGGGYYYESNTTGYDEQFVSWGVGLSERVNKWLTVGTRFIQVRRTETGSSAFLPSGTQSGPEAVGDYIVVGFAVSFEAFRWSWQ